VYPQGSHRNASNTPHRTAFAGPDVNGNLLGATSKGDIGQAACSTASGCGMIFEMTPKQDGTWTYHVLQRFASYPTDGQIPTGGMVMDKSGNFYGTILVRRGAARHGRGFQAQLHRRPLGENRGLRLSELQRRLRPSHYPGI
jgi:hypothetical protein